MSERILTANELRIAALASWLRALWKFARPHTIIGTTLSLVGLYAIAYAYGVRTLGMEVRPQVAALCLAWLSCIGANIYIVGLNQITDVEIDRINKPDLPLASGAYSLRTGWAIVLGCVALSLGLAVWQGGFLLITVAASLLIGTAYSVPPLRLKRFHLWAAVCILAVRGVIVNLFLFLHFSQILLGRSDVPAHVWLLVAFVFGFSVVIAWFKDIPDMQGDGRFKIATLSLKLGARRVFVLGRGLLALCYAAVIVAGVAGLAGVNGPVLAISHALLLMLMWWRGRGVEPTDQQTMSRYYLFVWLLFFLEYLVYPLSCWLA